MELDLINPILETFIIRGKHFASTNVLYRTLSAVDYSVRLPFSLPLQRIAVLLGHLGLNRSQFARAFLLRDDDARERRAHLAGHDALGTGDRRRHRRDVGVVEHDRG